jgi:membrane protein involved in colicin uptake
MAVEKATETWTAEETMTAKAAEEAVMAKVAVNKAAMDKAAVEKVAAYKAVADKVIADKAAVTKVAEEVVVKATVDVSAMKTANQGVAVARSITGLAGSRSGSSPGPAAGSKRAVVPGGSCNTLIFIRI